jgi:FAD/FMN-containing dehydrogenase
MVDDDASWSAVLASLRATLGTDHVLTEPGDRSPYEQPWRGPSGSACAVVRPSDVDEVRAVVRIAVAHRRPLVVQGANTGLVGAGVPDASGDQIILSLTRLDRIRDLDALDRTVVVESGCTREMLDAALGEHDLELPIDLGASASVGGMIATNTGGARMLRHGDMRRRVLGAEVVMIDEDATLLSDLRALRKDNGRLHLHELIVGGDGRRGIVTAAALEVELRSASRATALLVPADATAALAALSALEHAVGAALTAFEVISRTALTWLASALPDVTHPFSGAAPELTVLVELADRDPDRDLDELLLRAIASLHDQGHLIDALSVPPATAWRLRHSLSEAAAVHARAQGRVLTALDVSVRRSRLPQLVDALERSIAESEPAAELAHFGHWGDGGVHLLIALPDGADTGSIDALRQQLYALVDRCGGSFSAEHGVGPHNVAAYTSFVPTWQREIEDRIARLFDPHRLLGHSPSADKGVTS